MKRQVAHMAARPVPQQASLADDAGHSDGPDLLVDQPLRDIASNIETIDLTEEHAQGRQFDVPYVASASASRAAVPASLAPASDPNRTCSFVE